MEQKVCVKLILVEIIFISVSLLVFELGSRSYGYSQKKAYSAFDKGNYQEALKQFNEREKKNPKDIENLYNKGVTEYKLKKYDDSIESFASVASSTKDKNLKIQSLFNLGNAEAQVSNFDGAIASYEEALKLDPDNERIKSNLEYVKQLKEQKQNQNQDQNNKDNKNDQNKDQNQDQNQSQDQNQNQEAKNDQNQDQNRNQEAKNDQNQDQNQPQDQNQNQEAKNDQNKDQDKNQAQVQDQNRSEESRENNLSAAQEEKSDEQKLKEKQAQAILNRVEDKAPEYMNKLNSKERSKMKNKKVDKDW